MRHLLPIALGGLLLGCGTQDEPTPPSGRVPGFNPPPPMANELSVTTPIMPSLAPGVDVTLCTYLDQRFDAETDIVDYRVFQSATGHHAILFAAIRERPVGTHECTDDDMVNSRFLAASGGESVGTLTIPPGLAFRIPARSQLMFQTHWINASPKPIDGQAVAYVRTQPSSKDRQVLDLFNIVNTQFSIPGGQKVSSSSTCKIGRDLQLYTMSGHAHELGSHIKITLDDQPIWDYDWRPEYLSAPPYSIYSIEKPLLLKAGQRLSVTCTWDNTGSQKEVNFPREMCVASGFYFPALAGEIDCVDGNWSG